jgi:hypothetical protein
LKFTIKKPAKKPKPSRLSKKDEALQMAESVETIEVADFRYERDLRQGVTVLPIEDLEDDTVYAIRHYGQTSFGTFYSPILGRELKNLGISVYEHGAVRTFPNHCTSKHHFIIRVDNHDNYLEATFWDGPYIPIHVWRRKKPALKFNKAGTIIEEAPKPTRKRKLRFK